MNPVILIPARMAATRFPGKPLADLGGRPMIVHVARRAGEAAAGPVIVAAGDPEIAEAARAAGFESVMTGAHHQSGSDRIFEALGKIDPEGRYDVIINVQGDLPSIAPEAVQAVLAPLRADAACDIATLVAELSGPEELENLNVVKAVVLFPPVARTGARTEVRTGARTEVRTGARTEVRTGARTTEAHTGARPGQAAGPPTGRALDFTRAAPPDTGEDTGADTGAGRAYHHIGIYAYRRAALARFTALAPSPREQNERLEQLRALEAGMHIGAALVDSVPHGVDTPADLEKAARIMGLASAPRPAP